MGDVLTLIERAEQATSEDEAKRLEAQMRKGQFTFDDFLQAQKMLRRMGPLGGIMKMIPGMGQIADLDVDENRLKRVEAIVLSMTPRERALPHTIDGHRRARIAAGSGVTVPEVNQLLEARKMMEKMMGQVGKGKMPALPGMGGMPGMGDMGLGGLPAAPVPWRRSSAGTAARNGRPTRSGRVVGNLDAWQSSSGSLAWAPRRTRSTVSSRPTRARRGTGRCSRSWAATTRRPSPRPSSSTRRRSSSWLGKGAQPTEAVARLIKTQGISHLMAELLAYLARELVDDPGAVRVESEERDGALVLLLHVAPDDVGKVIGRGGRIIRALRTVVRASSARDGRRVLVELAD